MTVFLIILGALVGVGLPLYLLHRYEEKRTTGQKAPDNRPEAIPQPGQPGKPAGISSDTDGRNDADREIASTSGNSAGEDDQEVCCGMHLTCEKDSLLADVSDTVDYFDDEELDRFAGREADSYTPDELEEFRDVLLTLIPSDIAPWARSIQLRGITLPAEVRDELLMIVAEARKAKENNA